MLKSIVFFWLLMSAFLFSQPFPIAGKPFLIKYDPSEKGILTHSQSIQLHYVFDYWGTRHVATEGAKGLFQNVLNPDSGRAIIQPMIHAGKKWTAKIAISPNAKLISYYFSDGNSTDDNDKKTYVQYIYNDRGQPARGARFRNIDFLKMADASPEKQLAEIKAELATYPDYPAAHFAYWDIKFGIADDHASLTPLKSEFEKYFSDLEKKFGKTDSLLNYKAAAYYAYSIQFSKITFYEQEALWEQFYETAVQVPKDKRTATVQKAFEGIERRKQARQFSAKILGNPAPDFQFETIDGKQNRLSDFHGKYVLLDFWGTWCGPCVADIPRLRRVHERFKDRPFEMISISSDKLYRSKDEAAFKAFVTQKQMNWLQVLDNPGQNIIDLYKIAGFPTLYLIDTNGIVIKTSGELWGKKLSEILSSLLEKESSRSK